MLQENFKADIRTKPMSRRVDWHESKSPYGYVLGEALSAMGKEIRRGSDFSAAFWAHQMAISGSQAEDFLWERLRVIAVEDCGVANPEALTIVTNAQKLYYDLPEYHEDRYMVVSYAAQYLALSPKTRMAHDLYHVMAQQLRSGMRMEIPDYAVDLHTRRGQQLGRGVEHFLEHGARLENETLRHSYGTQLQALIKAQESKG